MMQGSSKTTALALASGVRHGEIPSDAGGVRREQGKEGPVMVLEEKEASCRDFFLAVKSGTVRDRVASSGRGFDKRG